jgi:hypothetical protein
MMNKILRLELIAALKHRKEETNLATEGRSGKGLDKVNEQVWLIHKLGRTTRF